MAKKVFELANELDLNSLDLVEKLKEMGFQVRNHMSLMSDEDLAKFNELNAEAKAKSTTKKKVTKKKTASKKTTKKTTKKVAANPDKVVTVKEQEVDGAVSAAESTATSEKKKITVRKKAVIRKKASSLDSNEETNEDVENDFDNDENSSVVFEQNTFLEEDSNENDSTTE